MIVCAIYSSAVAGVESEQIRRGWRVRDAYPSSAGERRRREEGLHPNLMVALRGMWPACPECPQCSSFPCPWHSALLSLPAHSSGISAGFLIPLLNL